MGEPQQRPREHHEPIPFVRAGSGSRKIGLLFNPDARVKAGVPTTIGTTPEALRQLMARHRLGDELILTASAEEARAATQDAVRQRYELVIAAGGDGTVGPIAGEVLNSKTALGILPLGSVMNIARMLELPRGLAAAAVILATGTIRVIDVGEANGQVFFEGGSVGLNAAIFQQFQYLDAGRYRSLLAALWLLLRYRPARMVLHLDDRTVATRALIVAVANGPYTGLGFTVAPDARLDDGRFDVRVFQRFSRGQLFAHLGAIAFGRRRYSPKIATYHSRRGHIESVHPLPCRADSHDLGTTPVTFVVRRAALKVIGLGVDGMGKR